MSDDEDQEKAFEERFNKFFHKAMGEREKRFEKNILKRLDESLGSKMDELRTLIMSDDGDGDEQPPPIGDDGKQRPAPTGQQTQALPPEIAAAVKRAERQAKDAMEKAERFEREAKEEKAKLQRSEEQQQLTQLLTGRVKPAVLDMVVRDLHGSRVVRDEDGKILWKGDDDQMLPLKDGVEGWARSDVGKEFAPPANARGSGGRGADGAVGKDGTLTMEGFGDLLARSMGGS